MPMANNQLGIGNIGTGNISIFLFLTRTLA